ncbi:transposase [Parafilimonas terrae]|uniref:transposase n=1 Tax=Parafilimonas terrae TaxID=1465490 RepID=UPI000B84873A
MVKLIGICRIAVDKVIHCCGSALLLKKRGMIESINDVLKTIYDIEHTRHQSPINASLNVFAAICVYTFLERFPNIFNR